MKIKRYITYYSNLRNLTPNCLPLSTAIYPPVYFKVKGWKDKDELYHQNLTREYGLWIGGQATELVPMIKEDDAGCPCTTKDPSKCGFLRDYAAQLDKIDFKKFIHYYEELLVPQVNEVSNTPVDSLVVLVFEKPDNPCSERSAIIPWFRKNGIDIEEWAAPQKKSIKIRASLI